MVAIHLAMFGFTIHLYRNNVVVFLAIELALLASLALGMFLIRGALRPLEYTARFRDLLEDEDYSARLVDSKLPELDELVHLFNTMLSTLYRERLELGEQRGFLDSLLEATPSAVIVFDFEGKISLMNASAHALLNLDEPKGKALSYWGDTGLLRQLNTLPLGESRLLTDAEGRRYRAQRGHFHDRGFSRHFPAGGRTDGRTGKLGTRHLRQADPRARARSQQYRGGHRLGARFCCCTTSPS
ncbi:hypothetical protein LP420_33760 [Massilia sp. B-10]|nr:hypothetical protein LP420_33760 [Massilia sp. B-10]